MKTLGVNWITDKHIDFEYKKYILLDYLQAVNQNFEETKLYPALSDLVSHYRNLLALKEKKRSLYGQFPERIVDIQSSASSFKWIYKKTDPDDFIMKEIEEIIDYSLPQLEKHLTTGKQIYDRIEEHLTITPVGLVPIYPLEGYFFLKNAYHDTMIYEFQITIFERPDEKYRGIHTSYITTFKKSLTNTFEEIKLHLIKHYNKLPNPATYAIETDIDLPFDETFLPIAKRAIVKYIN
jgi:hypothetical protein